MRVVVMGAGVIGVTTAYYLAKGGAEVTVLDRQAGPGLETSYANAGELSYGMTSPWAAPGVPVKALKWLFMKRRPLFIWPLISPTMWMWGLQMLRNCNEESYRVNKSRMVRISNYSRDVMPDLIAETGIDYDGREQGTLQLFRTAKQLEHSHADQEILSEFGSPFEVLDRDGCIVIEPALAAVRPKFVGGLRLTADRTGDCRMFTIALAEKWRRDGGGVPVWPVDPRHRHRGRQGRGGRHGNRGPRHRRQLCLRAGELWSARSQPHRREAAGLPGQGLLGHVAA